ncbi:GNAT family N-acetyltransferase [Terrabacter sp. BE26]|uniref:GNAT family N-acetyltransferase n=1 Tax=Terrabacter sp. BE26 TaxID=2898152 RepID=UPI0035BE992B
MGEPGVRELDGVVEAMRAWQFPGAPVQLHPGDLGWHWRFGADTLAAALRTWSRDGQMVAVGMLDSPSVLRLAVAPGAQDDEELARQLLDDVGDPDRGVLQQGSLDVEARCGGVVRQVLLDDGWVAGEAWTPLERDLAEPVEDSGVRVATVGPRQAGARTAVQRAAFERSTFTEERWHAMAAGSPYADARCLLAFDDEGRPVAAATVWSAGPGRPGLLEPVGVHPDHRGRGYGRAVSCAAASALREMGSSSAVVCTQAANVGAVATYASAGYRRLPDVPDLHRAERGEPGAG